MNLVIDEGKILSDPDLFPFHVFIHGFRQRQKCVFLLRFKQITSGTGQSLEVFTVLLLHLLPENRVQFFKGIERHVLHIDQNMHIDDADMSFHIRFPAGRTYFRRLDDCTVVFRPCLKVSVQRRTHPVFVLGNRYLAVIGSNRLRDTAKVVQRIVVDTEPVGNITAGHALDVEVVAV